jgi:DNA-binding response OmpR family regulator
MTPRPDTSYHILIVEDNRTQAEYLRHILEKKGHQVMVSTNGIEALEMIEAEKPDLILTDVMMPDMDGYKLCETIKNHKRYHDIPVILVTHLYSPVDVIRGLEAGADNFIIKPYDPESIFSRIAGIKQAAACPSEEQNQPLDVVFSSEVHTISSSRIQISHSALHL